MDDRRNSGEDANTAKTPRVYDRCIVISPRHDFIRPWIRAYFATGNAIPLVIIPGPEGDWRGDDMEYCQAAARFCGGQVFDCSAEWRNSKRLAARAAKGKVGWYTKKNLLLAVATRLAPRSWAWIDDDAEVTGALDECFDYADKVPGFICTQFYHPDTYTPDSVDCRHPAKMYKWKLSGGEKLCWNSLVFFHGEANERLKDLDRDFPVEDDEIVFGDLYKSSPAWHEGFWDFSSRRWQANCKKLDQIPKPWSGKLLHYTSNKNGGEVKKYWAARADALPKAPFEHSRPEMASDGPVDAVFVIGTGSKSGNEELRYALRSLDANCKFVRNVYICGECPPWVDRGAVRHLQWPDRFHHAKDANIIDKLRHACEAPGIARRILFCSDDQFQTRPCAWEDFAPRYLRVYDPKDGWYDKKHRVWHTRLRKTLERERLRREAAGNKMPPRYFQPHIWMPIDRDRFIDYARWCGYERRDDTIIASGYFNFVETEGAQDFDHVFLGAGDKDTPKALHVAYHDGSCAAAMAILRRMFPERSRFELAPGARASAVPTPPTPPAPSALKPPARPAGTAVPPESDPSPATPQELASLLRTAAAVRNNPVWHNLLGEVSRAEEMRLFGVKGWRVVWNDIAGRWARATHNGADAVPVLEGRSEAAVKVSSAYMSNPQAMRTVSYGPQSRRLAVADPAQAEKVRARVRSALHLRGR